MKTRNAPKKLIGKRTFARRQAALQEKHQWILKGNPLDIRPGWLHILETALLKIRNVLTAEDIEQSRLEFVYSSSRNHLNIFLEGEKLSQARFNAIQHIIDEATRASESSCAKCGREFKANTFRQSGPCEEHREFDGDFIEDQRRFLARKKADAEAAAAAESKQENEEAEDLELATDADIRSDEALAGNIADGAAPTLRIYDLKDVQKIKDNLKTRSADADSRGRLKTLCDEMIRRGGERPYCTLPDPVVFDDLVRRFPNFQATIEVIRSSVALAKLGNGRLEIPPLLLVGPPGIGKTQVANEIAVLFETSFLEIHMEAEQTGACISGSSEFWSNTQTGLIFNALTTGKTANPMILLDELDKAGGDSRFDPAAGLYGLLERETAQRFEDLSIRGLPIDASAIIWIITANDETRIPAPILSRTLVQHIRPPTLEESVRIAQSIYVAIRKSKPWGSRFQPELPDGVAERLAELEPRKMKTNLLYAFGRAAITARDRISPNDLPNIKRHRHFGFLPDSPRHESSSKTAMAEKSACGDQAEA